MGSLNLLLHSRSMMTEKSIIEQVMSEKIDPEDGDEKANPIEGLTIRKGTPKVVSRYLSDSKGSCHDVCKYDNERAVGAKPWKTTKNKVATRERKTEVPEEDVPCLARNKKSGTNSKPSQVSKTGKSNIPVEIIKEVTNEKKITSEKNSAPFEETDLPLELNNSDIGQAQSEPSSISVQEGSKNQTKREIVVKNKCAFASSSRKETATEIGRKQTRTSLTGGKEKSKRPSNPLSPEQPSSSSAKTAKNLTEESSMKNHENVEVEEAKPELESNENLPDKILNVIEPTNAYLCEELAQACDASKLPSPPPSSSGEKNLKQNIKKTSKSGAFAASSRKGLRHGTRSNAYHISYGDKGKRNMLHKTGCASRSQPVLSSISSSNSSLGKQSVATSKLSKTGLKKDTTSRSPSVLSSITSHGKRNVATSYKSYKTRHGSQGENVKVGYKISPKLSTIVGGENKVVSTRNLTFRRGRVVEVQPQSNNIARRLKFRPARLLGDDFQNGINGTRKRIITSKECDSSESNAANIKAEKVVYKHQTVEGHKMRTVVRKIGGDRSKINGSKSGSEKVVLRHQNVIGKKVNPRLYNNVIEETASMLAELRKSKVKALVGAFETVISLDSPRAEATPAELRK